MKNYFKVSNNGADDWLICWTGQDNNGTNWNVTTNQIHASELYDFSKGAEEDAKLIAELLNKHYSGDADKLQAQNARLVSLLKEIEFPCPYCGGKEKHDPDGNCELENCLISALDRIE
jgi:hypothetical protein